MSRNQLQQKQNNYNKRKDGRDRIQQKSIWMRKQAA